MLAIAQGMLRIAPGQQLSHVHVDPLLRNFDAILVPPASVQAVHYFGDVHYNLQ